MLTATGYDRRERPRGGWHWLAATVAVLLAAIPPIQAQTPPTKLPGTVEPGRREAPAPEPAAPLDLQWIIDLPPGVEPPESLAGEILRLEDLKFLGVTAYERGDLLPLFEACRAAPDKMLTNLFSPYQFVSNVFARRYINH